MSEVDIFKDFFVGGIKNEKKKAPIIYIMGVVVDTELESVTSTMSR